LPADLGVTVVVYPPQKALTYAQLVEHVRERLPPKRSLIFCAESFSGPIAIRLAHLGALNVKGIILCATFARSPRPLLLSLARLLPLPILFRFPIPRLLVRLLFLGREVPESLLQLFLQSISRVSATTLAVRLREVAAVDTLSTLEAIGVPCCYIRAKSDALVPLRCLRPFQEAIPGLVVKEVEGPHLILQANPKGCSRAISEFLNTLRDELS
jgi:pimeloyl-ACP methyl ester carboxylesterase